MINTEKYEDREFLHLHGETTGFAKWAMSFSSLISSSSFLFLASRGDLNSMMVMMYHDANLNISMALARPSMGECGKNLSHGGLSASVQFVERRVS